MFKNISALLCAIVLAGCAGTDFVRPDSGSLDNGKTSYNDVVKKFGAPSREGTVLKNGQNLKSISYAYASVGGEPKTKGVIPARAMGFYFNKDILVGHEFISSWKQDNSDFDDTKIPMVIKGKTSRAEVIQMLGKPTGNYIYPMIQSTAGDAAVYIFSEASGTAFNMKFFRKVLIVSFDEKGIVSDVDFSTSGSKSASK